VEVVRKLLKHGAKVGSADNFGYTPLYRAASNGYVEVVRELLKHGAKVESAYKPGWTPPYRAAFYDELEFIQELFKHDPLAGHLSTEQLQTATWKLSEIR
jgi:ankyrin repeat protein